MLKSSLFAVAICTVGFVGASSASAAVYTVTSDHCTGGCLPSSSFITATDVGGNLNISVTLLGGDEFMHGPTGTGDAGKNTFAFDLNLASINISGLVSPWETNGVNTAGSFAMDGAGKYDYAINYTGNGGPTGVTTLSFDILGASVSDIPLIDGVFAADIRSGSTGNTGVIDFSLGTGVQPGIPEISTWAMMLLGFAGLGFAGYRSSRKLAPSKA